MYLPVARLGLASHRPFDVHTCLCQRRFITPNSPRRNNTQHVRFAQTTQARKLEAQVAKLETAVASATTAASGKASKAEAKAAEAKVKAVETKMKKEIDQAEAKNKVIHREIARVILGAAGEGAVGRVLGLS